MTTGEPWLEIDIKGFAQILHNKGIARVALEPISNAFDTAATEIAVDFTQSGGWAELVVTDDDLDGFTDLKDAYTLYAPSTRRDDPTKRGRYGLGEKELIAVCSTGGTVAVASTTGTIFFEKDGRRRNSRVRTESGTALHARFRCTKEQSSEFEFLVGSLLAPANVKLVFNGEVIRYREPVKTVRESLRTIITDDEGNLTNTTRITDVHLIEPESWEVPTIFELGVPVVEHDGRWHVNVGQKVPLNADRDNVTPSYLRRLREIMLNETHELLDEDDMKAPWVAQALPTASPEAIRSHVVAVHGEDAVIFDPSNPEASKRAVDNGRTVVYGRQYPSDTWTRIKDNQILRPAGQVIQTAVPTSPDGKPPIDREIWTPAMFNVERYVKAAAQHVLGIEPEVEFQNINVSTAAGHAGAWWGDRTITFNLRFLGKQWPETVTTEELDRTLIHEFTHHTVEDHLSDAMIRTLCKVGAKLRSCPESLSS
jgi:hypothetical protein